MRGAAAPFTRRLRWAGHVSRMSMGRPRHNFLKDVRRPRGRPFLAVIRARLDAQAPGCGLQPPDKGAQAKVPDRKLCLPSLGCCRTESGRVAQAGGSWVVQEPG
eukprot:CAMPEP_0185213150 /NCGR_PEP_ID=MMETSP1140-20130426/67888_1 /TAXON_ID=298111 /ORGANISM="Pavlova sp., Strain CCMP459" /LENGTH=103 /DNA_ID=CAMNT_0027781009 /DNA_START=590 /DNA_END=901 /DNA_ORIENTATION=-